MALSPPSVKMLLLLSLLLCSVTSSMAGDCVTRDGDPGQCSRERDCDAVVRGRYFPTICRLPNTKKIGVCCKIEQSENVTTTTTTTQASPPRRALRCGEVSFTIDVPKTNDGIIQFPGDTSGTDTSYRNIGWMLK